MDYFNSRVILMTISIISSIFDSKKIERMINIAKQIYIYESYENSQFAQLTSI